MTTDRRNVTLVIATLAGLGLVALAGGIILAAMDKPVPEQLWLIATGALSALAALLASTRSSEPLPPPPPAAAVLPTTPGFTGPGNSPIEATP